MLYHLKIGSCDLNCESNNIYQIYCQFRMLSLCRAATFLGAVLAFDPTPHPEVGQRCDAIYRGKFFRSVQRGRKVFSLERNVYLTMVVRFQTVLNTSTPTTTYHTTTSILQVRTGPCSQYLTFCHSDCSRFWECGPAYETCLFECASCPCLQFPGGVDDPECNYQCEGEQGFQWALTFDEK